MLSHIGSEIAAVHKTTLDTIYGVAKRRAIQPRFLSYGMNEDAPEQLDEIEFDAEDAAAIHAALSERIGGSPSVYTLDFLAQKFGMTFEAAADVLIAAGVEPLYSLNDESVFTAAAADALALSRVEPQE